MEQQHHATTLTELCDYWADRRPDQIAYRFEDRVTTFAEIREESERLARALDAQGIDQGRRIAWIGKNSDRYFTLFFAAARVGAALVPIGWRLAAPEMKYILKDAEAEAIVAAPEFVQLAEKLAAGMLAIKHVWASEDGGSEPSIGELAREADPKRALRAPLPENAVIQLYTSGTTGQPKGVVLTQNNFLGRSGPDLEVLSWDNWHEGDSGLNPMPVAHIAGSGYGLVPFNRGSACTITQEFNVEEILDLINRKQVTRFFLVPAALQMLITHPKAAETDTSHINQIGYGASPIPLTLLRDCMKAFPNAGFVQSYGMTETTGSIAILPPEDHEPAGNERMRSAGKAVPGVEIMVADPEGKEVPRGELGEVCTRSSANMAYYWKQPEKTKETVNNEGWLHTGDAAYMDEDGYIYIQDRIKDMIITGGENVYPAEVENALYEHPAVSEAAVIGVQDGKWGEAVKAIITLKSGAEFDEQAIINHVRERLADFKTPKSVEVIEIMPRNASGKILRKDLRAPYWEGSERQVN